LIVEIEDIIEAFTSEGFARRVEIELDALGYPENHILRQVARARMTPKEGS
jgi:hypothetical protein